MKVTDPADNHRVFLEYVRAGDAEGIVSRYEPGAVLIGPGRIQLAGHDAIRAGVGHVLPSVVSAEFELVDLVVLGDLAYERLKSRTVMRDADGDKPVESGSYVILRRQPDGNWLILLDDSDM